MQKFKYAAKDARGQSVSGMITAGSQSEAINELRRQSLTVLSVRAAGAAGKESGGRRGSAGGRKKIARPKAKKGELILFTRQLSTMIGAGIPLLEALEILNEQAESPGFKQCVGGVVEEVRTGADLSSALQRYPRIFTDLYISMIKAGEVSGQLDLILVRLAEYLEAADALRREVKSAMTYPVISLVLVFGIAGFLMIGIVPSFKPVFTSLEIELPALTSMVMDTADWMKNNVLAMFGIIAGFFFAFSAFKKSARGKAFLDAFYLRVPIFGPLIRKIALSRFSRTFSTLIKSGVPILAAMDIVGVTSGNAVVSKAIDHAKVSVRSGETLWRPLSESPVFPPMVTKMIAIGEKSGALETLLEKIAVFYDEQVSAEVKSLTSMIEPIMISVMGFIVGTIVLAVFLPIFKLQEKLATG
ncbi:MAG: type II secretion system F family protein [Planctomycetes bacterium]|nr:type II secretion system F family protein [Planctomycetota bacterium]